MAKEYQILRETLNNVFNQSELDIGGKYFVLKDFYRDIEVAYYNQLNKEVMEEKEGAIEDAESVQSNQLGELSK